MTALSGRPRRRVGRACRLEAFEGQADGHSALTDSGDALDGAAAHVADGEYDRPARLQEQGWLVLSSSRAAGMSLPVKRKPCLSSAADQPATRRPDAGPPLGPGWLALLLAVWASPLGRTYVTAMWSVDRPSQWVGRGEELAVVRAGVEALGRGEGAVVWVEGEPGIGKSSLVAEALAGGAAGWDIGWGDRGQAHRAAAAGPDAGLPSGAAGFTGPKACARR